MGTAIMLLVVLVVVKFAYSVIFEQDRFDNDGNYRNK